MSDAVLPSSRPVLAEWVEGHAEREWLVAVLALAGILAHLALLLAAVASPWLVNAPLVAVLIVGGAPTVGALLVRLVRGRWGSDLLAAISIASAALLGQYLAGAIVVLMLSGGQALERLATRRASSVLRALAKRVPAAAHRVTHDKIEDVSLDAVAIGDRLMIFPHEICPVDGVVVGGRGTMDESYLTGEPFSMAKAPGSEVISGALNGDQGLVVRAARRAIDSRYARIMAVMQETEQRRPMLRRLGDQLGAAYTPLALVAAGAAWGWSGDPLRFLAVLVVATPCPLLIGIPVAIIGSISLAAKRSIIVRDPAVLEQCARCRTIIFDKTGTLTYGRPTLTDRVVASGLDAAHVLRLAASLERYSKHPLASAILAAARQEHLALLEATEIAERPGEGLEGLVNDQQVRIAGRRHLSEPAATALPPAVAGLECVVMLDGAFAALYRFRDTPREDSRSFIEHLGRRHGLTRVLLVSGDREPEVRDLATRVGISEVFAGCSPEEKVRITEVETARTPTIFVGDGINDAPALAIATVGVAFGHQSEITTEAAGAVIMDSSLTRVDEFLHISKRMRRIALQTAVGGMALSGVGMAVAFVGWLPPVSGAIFQEIIDLAAVLNALRAAIPPRRLTDFAPD